MPILDAIGNPGHRNPKSFTLQDLEVMGNATFSQLPAATQRWAEMQAKQLSAKGAYGPAQQRQLELQISGLFSQAEKSRVLAAVRFLALRASAGGNLSKLYSQRGGLTLFQKQLVGGSQLGA